MVVYSFMQFFFDIFKKDNKRRKSYVKSIES